MVSWKVEYMSTLIVVLTFGALYSLLDKDEFGFKDAIDSYYFSCTTFSTAGYGDFYPRTTRAKILVMLQQSIMLLGSTAILMKAFVN